MESTPEELRIISLQLAIIDQFVLSIYDMCEYYYYQLICDAARVENLRNIVDEHA